jgi:DNA-binding CsgD family transcriptional regulator
MAIARADETDLLIPLHEGVHEDVPWRLFLARLQQRVRAAEAAIVVRSGEMVVRYAAGREVVAEALDPWLAGLRRGRVYAAGERGGEARGHGRVVRADEPGGASAWLIVERAGRDFSAADGALLGALAPHLAVALRSLEAAERARLREAAAAVALTRAGVGWVALGRDARVLGASDAAFARVGERIGTVRGEAAGVVAAYCLAPGAPVAVDRGEVAMLLVPGVAGAAAIGLFVRARDGDAVVQARVLADMFGLAPSEARLAVAVAGGASLAEAAGQLGLTIETARNYSKRVFAKMRVRGQVDLVRAVAGSVAGLV